MNIWKGRGLADVILESVKRNYADRGIYCTLKVIGGKDDEPYLKGILRDASYCNIFVKRLHKAETRWYGHYISLDPKITVPDDHNLDGGTFTPCTAEAIINLLLWQGFEPAGADVVVIGRSERVGRPVSDLLLDMNATVTLAHNRTSRASLGRYIANADLIISGVGDAGFAKKFKKFKPSATLIDIGGDFVGIADDAVENFVPHVGGVGPVTRAILMQHACAAQRNRFEADRLRAYSLKP